jgi:DNA-directed RNA polymerase subunit alpha
MDQGVVEILTAQNLNYEDVYALSLKVMSDEEEKKALETFATDFEKASAVIPANEIDFRRGLVCDLNGQTDMAMEAFKSATSPEAKLYLAKTHLKKQQQTISRKLLKELVSDASISDTGLLVQIGMLAGELRSYDELVSVVEKLNQSEGAAIQLLRAFQDELAGDHQGAIDGFTQVSEGENIYEGLALFHLARLQDLWGDDDLALETYRKIEEKGYAFEESLVNTGVILEDKGEFAAAMAYYEKALKINPANARAILFHEDAESSLNMHYDERKRRQDIKTSEILNIPISDFELSVRSRNCLSKMGIFTLRDLITKTEQELLSYKNFGETSLKEIRAMLAKKGLHLGMTRVEEQPLADRIKMNAQLYSQEKEYSLDELDTPIEDLDLSYRTKSALHKLGFESLRDITMRTGTDLESNPSFSAACMQEVNALLEEKGLTYRPATSTGKPEGAPSAAGSSLLSDEDSILEYE